MDVEIQTEALPSVSYSAQVPSPASPSSSVTTSIVRPYRAGPEGLIEGRPE